jgi:hypothetical protein
MVELLHGGALWIWNSGAIFSRVGALPNTPKKTHHHVGPTQLWKKSISFVEGLVGVGPHACCMHGEHDEIDGII